MHVLLHHPSATTLRVTHVPVGSMDPNNPSQNLLTFYPCSTRRHSHAHHSGQLCDELNNTASRLDLCLRLSRDVAGTDNDWDIRKATLSENLGIAVVEEVEDGGLVALLGEVGIALLGGDEGPELVKVDGGLPETVLHLVD